MNKKWYIDKNGVKVKPCFICKRVFPYDSFPTRGNGKFSAYCEECKKSFDRAYSKSHSKTGKIRKKNVVFVQDGIEYKRCTMCDKAFPNTFEYFDRSRFGQSGLHSRCRNCRLAHVKELKKTQWQKTLLRNAKASSKDRGLETLNITEEFIVKLWERQHGRCYWFGVQMIPSTESKSLLQPSLDRLDRTKGYTEDNVVLCCFAANFGRNENEEESWKQFLLTLDDEIDLSLWSNDGGSN